MKRKLSDYSELSEGGKKLFLEALVSQFITGLVLKLLPFRMIPRLYAMRVQQTSRHSSLTSQKVKDAIQKSGELSPWKNKCLVQSLAARWMLNRRDIGSQLFFGVKRDGENNIIAHAWLKTDDFEVVEKNGNYRELYFF